MEPLPQQPDPAEILKTLTAGGMTEAQIAEALAAHGVTVNQATLNRIKTGRHRDTSFRVGMGLVRLARARISSKRMQDSLGV